MAAKSASAAHPGAAERDDKEVPPVPEYSFISVAVKRRREGRMLADDYREIIRQQAASGWEFVQAIPLEKHTEPRIDLVFTRKGETP